MSKEVSSVFPMTQKERRLDQSPETAISESILIVTASNG